MRVWLICISKRWSKVTPPCFYLLVHVIYLSHSSSSSPPAEPWTNITASHLYNIFLHETFLSLHFWVSEFSSSTAMDGAFMSHTHFLFTFVAFYILPMYSFLIFSYLRPTWWKFKALKMSTWKYQWIKSIFNFIYT